ncbi:TonB-dependent receptor [Rhizobacter sp. J219]|uniref:TonB-dependent receptor plug domain-containing protein n=1 Tax=Rhizobacter sp. J219 TaxID=2898430 RepID=UPI002150F923|nr:TonB-dependent receptor [Rhizobacter sp. J219]MCR5883450.1 TonB-dependent receptor [Rhizobacter sp. J219]
MTRRATMKALPSAVWSSVCLLALGSAQAQSAAEPGAEPAAAAPASAPAASAPSLPRVEITTRSERAPTSRSVMSGDELRSVPGTAGDTMKALQALPGVAVADDSSAAPAVRGSRPDDNLYYVDFLPVGYLFHMGGLVSTVHSDLVRQFELYSAAFGPEYGDAIGAVLDVTLRNPRTDRLGGVLNVSLLGADALIEGPVNENQSFYFAVKRSYIDLLLDTVEDDSGVIISVPRYWDYQGKYLWNLNADHQLSFHATGAADKLEFRVPSGSTLATQEPVLAGDSAVNTGYGTQAVVWDGDFGGSVRNKAAFGRTVDRNTSSIGTALQATSRASTLFLREQLRFKPAPGHDSSIGGSVESMKIDYDIDAQNARCTEFDPECDYTSAPRQQARDSLRAKFGNAYASHRWQATDAWGLSLGVHHTRDGYLGRRYTEPRLGVEWKSSPDTTFTAAWGRHNQFPAGEQVIPGFGNTGLWHLRATHSVLGVAQKLDRGWSWKLEAYQKKFSDFVVSDPTVNYVNGGSGRSRGAELLVKKDPNGGGKLSGWLALSLSKARRQNDITGREFPFDFDQPVIAHLVMQYRQSERWMYGAKWSYHTGSPYTPITGSYVDTDGRTRPTYGELNGERLPAYHRLDLRADWKLSPRYSFYGELINAYARKNLSGYSYNADYSERKPVTQLPLLLSFGVLIKF